MASFDTENLFTNIPESDTINININKLLIDDNSNVIELANKFFKTLLDINVSNSFLYSIPFCINREKGWA